MLIKRARGWETPEREATPEHIYLNRREILKAAGFFGMEGLLAAATSDKSPYPAKRNPEFTLDRPITEEWASTGYNNFYEFNAEDKKAVKNEVGRFITSHRQVSVPGMVK